MAFQQDHMGDLPIPSCRYQTPGPKNPTLVGGVIVLQTVAVASILEYAEVVHGLLTGVPVRGSGRPEHGG